MIFRMKSKKKVLPKIVTMMRAIANETKKRARLTKWKVDTLWTKRKMKRLVFIFVVIYISYLWILTFKTRIAYK